MIRVDRLVFDIPGMTPGRAERLSRRIGATLEENGSSEHSVDVLLPPGAASDDAILAALAAALHARGA
jgi:hypothetical protein